MLPLPNRGYELKQGLENDNSRLEKRTKRRKKTKTGKNSKPKIFKSFRHHCEQLLNYDSKFVELGVKLKGTESILL